MKYKVTISTYWHNKVKYTRGDIIEADEGLEGGKLEVYIEPPKPKPAPKAKPKPAPEAKQDAPARKTTKRGITKVTKVSTDESI